MYIMRPKGRGFRGAWWEFWIHQYGRSLFPSLGALECEHSYVGVPWGSRSSVCDIPGDRKKSLHWLGRCQLQMPNTNPNWLPQIKAFVDNPAWKWSWKDLIETSLLSVQLLTNRTSSWWPMAFPASLPTNSVSPLFWKYQEPNSGLGPTLWFGVWFWECGEVVLTSVGPPNVPGVGLQEPGVERPPGTISLYYQRGKNRC